MQDDISAALDELKRRINSRALPGRVTDAREWQGADVIICGHLDEATEDWPGTQPIVISLQRTAPRRRAVVTRFSQELSWLFYQLRDIFSEHIDYVSKYDFYGTLAQSAIDYLERNQETKTQVDLLLAVLEQAEGWLSEQLGGSSTVH